MMIGIQVFRSLDELQCPSCVRTVNIPAAHTLQSALVQVGLAFCACALVKLACNREEMVWSCHRNMYHKCMQIQCQVGVARGLQQNHHAAASQVPKAFDCCTL